MKHRTHFPPHFQ